MIANEYDSQGCLFRQTLTDGRALTYSCARASDGSLQTTTFRDPAGALTHFSYDKGFYLQSLPEIALDRTEVSPE